ncbi:hypothetical protein [Sporanaerobacter acetigenes]|nr:hypothetical protein [Sporanaerobacter acetigenes]
MILSFYYLQYYTNTTLFAGRIDEVKSSKEIAIRERAKNLR